MIKFINDSDIIALLNLTDLTEQEKDSFVTKLSKIVYDNSISRFLEEEFDSEKKREELKKIMQKNWLSDQFSEEFLKKYPNFQSYLDEETYKVKKDFIIRLIVQTLEITKQANGFPIAEKARHIAQSIKVMLDSDQSKNEENSFIILFNDFLRLLSAMGINENELIQI